MTSLSPSSQKVDDFLSSVSQLSHERSQQDQQRQRDLQRNVDRLRQRSSNSPVSEKLPISSYDYSVPSLTFNRDRESPPGLPQRRAESPPPALPRRRDESPPPKLPSRTQSKPFIPKKPKELAPKSFSVDLVSPVARQDPKPVAHKPVAKPVSKPVKYTGPAVLKSSSDNFRSFAEVESAVKGKPDWVSSSLNKSPTSKQADYKPKPSYLSAMSSAQNSKQDHLASPVKPRSAVVQTYVPKGSPTVVDKWSPPKPIKMDKPASVETTHTAAKPAVPAKPKLSAYQAKDEELLQAQLAKIRSKPPPTKPKPSFEKFNSSDTQDLRTQLQKLSPSKPSKPAKPNFAQQDNELLNSQITRLKSSAAAAPAKPAAKPAAAPAKSTAAPAAPVSFRDQLSSIMRASTDPQLTMSPKPTQLNRTNSMPAKREDTQQSGDLKHATKTRAKGPKRRLPKSLAKADKSSTPTSTLKSASTQPKSLATPPKPLALQPAKVPPPVNKSTKPRAVSGANGGASSTISTGSATPHIAPSFDEELFI